MTMQAADGRRAGARQAATGGGTTGGGTRKETLYLTEISLCAGISVGPQDSEPWNLRRASGSGQASRLVILSADAPEWALVALRPTAGPARAMAALR